MTVAPDLEKIELKRGSHPDRTNGLCVMEVEAWIAGEPHSDRPECASRLVTTLMQQWNDSLPNDAERDKWLRPLFGITIGTRTTSADEVARYFLFLDWAVREAFPMILELIPEVAQHAAGLRSLAAIVSQNEASVARHHLASLDLPLALARARALDLALDLDLARARALDLARDLALALARARALALDRALDLALARYQESRQGLMRRMCAIGLDVTRKD